MDLLTTALPPLMKQTRLSTPASQSGTRDRQHGELGVLEGRSWNVRMSLTPEGIGLLRCSDDLVVIHVKIDCVVIGRSFLKWIYLFALGTSAICQVITCAAMMGFENDNGVFHKTLILEILSNNIKYHHLRKSVPFSLTN